MAWVKNEKGYNLSIGAFWKGTSDKGTDYLSGNLTIPLEMARAKATPDGVVIRVFIFKNSGKEKQLKEGNESAEKWPDYNMNVPIPQDEQE